MLAYFCLWCPLAWLTVDRIFFAVFFGSASFLLIEILRHLEVAADRGVNPRFLILDFRHVTGLDSTGAESCFCGVQVNIRELSGESVRNDLISCGLRIGAAEAGAVPRL